MDDSAMKEAKWIWTDGDSHARNAWVLFRRNFVIEDRGSLESALLRVCADTRYEAVLNGRRLAGGPVRSWPDELYYDSYPLNGAGKIGNNRLEILVNHFGLGTCVSIEGAAGLIAEILIDGADGGEPKRIVTDDSWLVAEHPGYVRTVPKMSNGLSWSEVFRADIASDEASWNWRPATVRGGGEYSSRRLLPRNIDYLTDEAVFPADVLSLREVRRRGFVRSVNLRSLAFPGELDLNKHKLFRGFIGFSFAASRAMTAHVAIANDPHDSKPLSVNLNGKTIRVENGTFLELSLDAGDNWILVNVSGMFHDPEFHFVFDLPSGCSLAPLFPAERNALASAGPARSGQDCDELCFLGPFGSISRIQAGEPLDLELPSSPEFDRLLAVTERADLAKFSRFAVALGTDTVSPHHVALDSFYQIALRDIPVTSAIRQICRPSVDDQASAGAEILSRSGDSELTLDFGKELSGYLEWDVDAPSGTELDFFCYESQHDGIVEHTFSLNNTVRYVCREGRQRYRSPVRRGFRFCRLTIRSPGGAVRIRQVRLNFATYPVPSAGRFRSSDYQLTKIWELCRHTVRVCMEDTFVDCPAYEQTLWTGDSFTSSLFSHYLFGRYEFPAHGNRLAAKSLERSPLIESTIPSAWQNVIPNWSFLWIQSCVDHFLYSGDRATFEELFPALMLTIRNAEKFILDDGPLRGLFSIDAWNFIDWAPLDSPDSGAVAHQNAILVWTMKRLASAAEMMGHASEAAELVTLASRLGSAIDAAFWSEERHAYIDSIHADGTRSATFSLHSQLFMLLADCAPSARRKAILPYLVNLPDGFVDIASPFVRLFHYMALLSMSGESREAWIFSEIRRIWGTMLRFDATTCWEGWSFIPGHYTRSHCHAWSCGPAYFIGANLLGIRPLEPGFRTASVRPWLGDLSWIDGAVPTPMGPIELRGNLESGRWKISITAPSAIKVMFGIPSGFSSPQLPPGGEVARDTELTPVAETGTVSRYELVLIET